MTCEPLTPAEKKWLRDLNRVLARCPSSRLGFYTIGDPDVQVIDQDATDRYEAEFGFGDKEDYCSLVACAGSHLGELMFPRNVHSTAG